jgi:hypothetical protein
LRSSLRLEALENRLNPSPTFTVINLMDSGGGSLRDAIAMANVAGAATINFKVGLNGTIQLTSGELQIMSNLRIDASVAAGTGPHQITVKAPVAGGRDFEIIGGWHATFVGDPNGTQPVSTGFIITGGNNVSFGGGIASLNSLASITLIGVDVTTNRVTSAGGGVFTLGTLGLYQTTIESNEAGINGGGTDCGKLFVAYNSLITGNMAITGSGGGAFDAGPGSTMLFSNTTVRRNSAPHGQGGGVFAHYNLVSLGSVFTTNSAGLNGGGIFSRDGNVYLTAIPASTRPAIPTSVDHNSAGASGGGVFADHAISAQQSLVIINTAATSGGGLFSLNGPVILSAAQVQGNMAVGGMGGGVFSRGDVFVTNGTSAIAVQGNASGSDGAGIWSAKDVVVTNGFILGNTSNKGSGGGIWAAGNVHVQDGTLLRNNAINGDGGGIADPSGNIYITSLRFSSSAIPPTTGSLISSNRAIDGGGLWDKAGMVGIQDETLIASNAASHDGGGIWTAGSLHMNTSTVQANAAVHGGGIAADNADEVTLYQSRIIFNRATAPASDPAAGGGVLAHNVADLSIRYSTIASNAAASGNGGGIAVVADTNVASAVGIDDSTFGGFTLAGVPVQPNSAGGFGGGIYIKNAAADLVHVTFNDNVAKGTTAPPGKAGSAIYAGLGATVTLEDTLVDDTHNLANPISNPGSSELLDSAVFGQIQSAGHNLVHDGSWANVANFKKLNGDIGNGHQDLGLMTFNQVVPPGPTFTETYRLLGSPPDEQAIGGGDDLGPTRDQNGRLRPTGAPSDIGSTQAF